eukprot:3529319-Rhodomonas_salina.1
MVTEDNVTGAAWCNPAFPTLAEPETDGEDKGVISDGGVVSDGGVISEGGVISDWGGVCLRSDPYELVGWVDSDH